MKDGTRSKEIHAWIREKRLFKDTSKKLVEISYQIELQTRGWINYYSKFRPSDMRKVFNPLNEQIEKWYERSISVDGQRQVEQVKQIANKHKYLFNRGKRGTFLSKLKKTGKSRMTGDCQVWFCERVKLKMLRPTRPTNDCAKTYRSFNIVSYPYRRKKSVQSILRR